MLSIAVVDWLLLKSRAKFVVCAAAGRARISQCHQQLGVVALADLALVAAVVVVVDSRRSPLSF